MPLIRPSQQRVNHAARADAPCAASTQAVVQQRQQYKSSFDSKPSPRNPPPNANDAMRGTFACDDDAAQAKPSGGGLDGGGSHGGASSSAGYGNAPPPMAMDADALAAKVAR